MKPPLTRARLPLIFFMSLGLAVLFSQTILFTQSAAGAWYWIHGHSGHIQDLRVIGPTFDPGWDPKWDPGWDPSWDPGWQTGWIAGKGWATSPHLGQGLSFVLAPGTATWVHFAIPSVGGGITGVQFIGLKFMTGAGAWVSQIDVFDGDKKLKSLSGPWSDGPFDLKLDLEKVPIKGALGLSVRVGAAKDTRSHELQFRAAGAYFVELENQPLPCDLPPCPPQ